MRAALLAALLPVFCGGAAAEAEQGEREGVLIGSLGEVLSAAPAPVWAEPAWPPGRPLPDAVAGSGGVEYVAATEQHNPGAAEIYRHYILRLKNPAGVQQASQIEARFDPEFQRVVFHRLDLIRGGERLGRLETARWRIVQQESQLDDQIFNGDATALCVVEDVRAGDLIEYAFTVRGQNPVFRGRWFDMLALGWDEPVGRLFYRVVGPPGRRIEAKTLGSAPPLSFGRAALDGGGEELRWEAEALPAAFCEDNQPDWFPCPPWLQISEASSWGDLVSWALPLYETGAADAGLDALVAELAARAKAENGRAVKERLAGEIIRFVQDEVRYQGFHHGAFAFAPAPPGRTAALRYGDCKDKARLLADLLHRAGIRSFPALVSTRMGPALDTMLPSPLAFDHLVVRIDDPEIGAAWVDPTIQLQGGGWNKRALGVSGWALEIRPGVGSLTRIRQPDEALPRSVFQTRIRSERIGGPVSMQWRAEFAGAAADWERARLAGDGAQRYRRELLEDLRDSHPFAEEDGPLGVEDDRNANRLVVTADFVLPDFWQERDEQSMTAASIYASHVADELPAEAGGRRSAALSLGEPREVTEVFVVELPEPWDVTESRMEVSLPELEYRSRAEGKGRTARLEYHLSVQRDHAEAERAPAVSAALRKISGDLGYEFSKANPR